MTLEKTEAAAPSDFIRDIVEKHVAEKKYAQIHTRFPPEPNGYLHIGHAKSICLNFGIAREFGGVCNLRMDDTNPAKEDVEYVDSITEDVNWLISGWADDKLGLKPKGKTPDIDTPLGPMIAVANEKALYLLEFVNRRGLEREMERLSKSAIIPGRTPPIDSIEQELCLYFDGTLKEFKTPLFLLGSPFQKRVWEQLRKIPYGETISYSDQAAAMGNPAARRAVARANGTNQIAIVIPCHRVINSNGELGGYGGGITIKKWLIDHEKQRK